MTELDKLEKYLYDHDIPYERIEKRGYVNGNIYGERNQIAVPVLPEHGKTKWDAICHKGSYGWKMGLLEIMGELVDEEKDGDSVVGYLTAEEVIQRLLKGGVNGQRGN